MFLSLLDASTPDVAGPTDFISLFFRQFGDQTFGLGVFLVLIGALIVVARKAVIPSLQLVLQISSVIKEGYSIQEAAATTFQENLKETSVLIRETLSASTKHAEIMLDLVRLHRERSPDETATLFPPSPPPAPSRTGRGGGHG